MLWGLQYVRRPEGGDGGTGVLTGERKEDTAGRERCGRGSPMWKLLLVTHGTGGSEAFLAERVHMFQPVCSSEGGWTPARETPCGDA